MTFQDESNQMAAMHPYVRLTAICRRVLSMAEVLHDVTDSRLKPGKPEEAMDLSEDDAEEILKICERLLGCLLVAMKQTGGKSKALDEYESSHDQPEQDTDGCPITEWTHRNLALVRDAAHDVAHHIRSIWSITPNWIAEQGLDRDEKRHEFVIVSVDWARRDILKQLAKLVLIFDEYDDSDSAQPWEAWLSPNIALGDD